MKKKVIVGMSGGVDSSVAALLLLQQGYDVTGVTMQIWQEESEEAQEDNGGCCGLSAVEDARRVCQILGIPHYVMNFRREFRENVMDYFAEEYKKGRTPNPCIACNRHVKWESLLRKSLALGAEYIATGHYARIICLPNGRFAVAASAAVKKDQTYALYNLTQDQLAHTLMPIGDYTKEEIRCIARGAGLPTAQKKDSMEICFVPDQDYAAFLDDYTGEKTPAGNFVDEEGRVLGRHEGITHYTVGQRKGLKIALGRRMFVKAIRPSSGEVVLSDDAALWSRTVYARSLQFMGAPDFPDGMEAVGKIRYNHQGAPLKIRRVGADAIEAIFDEPVRAAAPGQALVLYHPDGYVLGGGTIDAG